MSLKVYLAAPYGTRDSIRRLAAELEQIGMTATSSWLQEQHEVSAATTGAASGVGDDDAQRHVAQDFADIDRSDVLVVFTEPMWTPSPTPGRGSTLSLVGGNPHSGGRHIETGYAQALGKRVLVVGEPENIFHRALPVVPTWHKAVLWLVGETLPKTKPAAEVRP